MKYPGESSYNLSKMLEESHQIETPLAAILEHVFSVNAVSLYVYKFSAIVRVQMVHLYAPSIKDEPNLAEQGK